MGICSSVSTTCRPYTPSSSLTTNTLTVIAAAPVASSSGALLGQAEQGGEHQRQQEQDRQQAPVAERHLELLPGDRQRGSDHAHRRSPYSNSKRQAPMTKNAGGEAEQDRDRVEDRGQPLAPRQQVVEAGHRPEVRRDLADRGHALVDQEQGDELPPRNASTQSTRRGDAPDLGLGPRDGGDQDAQRGAAQGDREDKEDQGQDVVAQPQRVEAHQRQQEHPGREQEHDLQQDDDEVGDQLADQHRPLAQRRRQQPPELPRLLLVVDRPGGDLGGQEDEQHGEPGYADLHARDLDLLLLAERGRLRLRRR